MYLKTGDERILQCIEELSDYLCSRQHPNGFWVKETLPGLNRNATLEEQGQWLRVIQLADCALSIANVLKHLSEV